MSNHSNDWYDEEPTLVDVGIREVDYDPLDYSRYSLDRVRGFAARRRQGCLMMIILMLFIVVGFAGTLGVRNLLDGDEDVNYKVVEGNFPMGTLSPVFTDEVEFWADDIVRWAETYSLDPNLIATVIQIESCGNPQAGSPAGAQGLFQVMPFHFAEGEAMLNVDNNARRGLNYLAEGLRKAEGHVGLALAGYNGGHGMISWGYARWPAETRRYHYWGTGLYYDAVSGQTTSDRLDEWLAAGGSNLCNQAANVQQLLRQNETG